MEVNFVLFFQKFDVAFIFADMTERLDFIDRRTQA